MDDLAFEGAFIRPSIATVPVVTLSQNDSAVLLGCAITEDDLVLVSLQWVHLDDNLIECDALSELCGHRGVGEGYECVRYCD